jgi:hypothetical protein
MKILRTHKWNYSVFYENVVVVPSSSLSSVCLYNCFYQPTNQPTKQPTKGLTEGVDLREAQSTFLGLYSHSCVNRIAGLENINLKLYQVLRLR